jgi:hypothetical protein
MRNFCIYSILLFIWLFDNSISYSQGSISSITKTSGFKITVSGYASKELWLGCTINYDTYKELDLTPVKISKGSFSQEFDLYKGFANNIAGGDFTLPVAVALWQEKISLKECEQRYGKGSEKCKWARKNNYQLEGRVARKTEVLDFE